MTRLLVCIGVLLMPAIAIAQGRVATPTFSVEGGEYSTIVMVTIRVSTAGATIRYTQNGLDPTESDPLVVSGSTIAINTTRTLKARAFAHGRRPSDVRTATYTIAAASTAPALGGGAIAAGGAQTLVATPEGRVFEWRRDAAPQLVNGVNNVVSVSAARRYALALTNDGRVFGWGGNDAAPRLSRRRGRRAEPSPVEGLGVVTQIAAGGDHGLALTSDGRVWAWGSNSHGQLGVPSGRRARQPAVVPSLSDVVAIGAGDAHSVAVTTSGEVFAWGSNTHGQLGDGTRTNRRRPTRIALVDVADVAAGATHTLAMTRAGDVYSWGSGSRGELGTGSLVAVTQPAHIANLRAAAIQAGRRFSAAVTRNGALMMWGANDSGQLADGTTDDKATPVAGPALSSISAVALGGRHTVVATSTGDVWTWGRDTALTERMSDITGWGPPLVDEAVAAPVIEPASGSYSSPQTVTLAATTDGVTLRYTLDGSEPTLESTLYVDPFVVATSAEVRARAFAPRSNLEPGPVSVATFVIDMVPPVIVFEVSPVAGVDWYTTPVTITFRCADDSGSVSCSPPATLSSDGAGQLVTGVAIDPAGNRSTTSVTVNIDQAGPTVLLDAFPHGEQTTSDERVLLRGRVYDNASGLADLPRCNGSPVTLVEDVFECLVALRPGRNSITLQAIDVVGHVTAAGLVITRHGEMSAMSIAPDSRTMAMSEVAALSLHDEFGVAVTGATWSSSDETVAVLSSGDPPVVTAVGEGTTTIVAIKNTIAAESTITVDSASVLAPGKTRWTLGGTPGWTMGVPMMTHRVDVSVPDMFLVESEPSGEASLRAVTADGAVLWRERSAGPPLMGDSFGGVIAAVYHDTSWDFKAYVRLGNAGGVPPWRYESRGSLLRPAQAPDGTVFAVELVPGRTADGKEIWDKHVIVIDGKTGGLLRRWPLARERSTFTAELDGVVVREHPRLVCASTRREDSANILGPIVGSDGRGYLLVRRLVKRKFDQCIEQHARPRRIIDQGIDLLILSANADPVVRPIFDEHCDVQEFQFAGCDVEPIIQQLVPDGVGGILASWDRFERFLSANSALLQRVVSRHSADGDLANRLVDNTTRIQSVGQDGVTYIFASNSWTAVDVTTWTNKWTASAGTAAPIATHPDGGVSLFDYASSSYRELDATGSVVAGSVTPMPAQWPVQAFDSWIGLSPAGLTSVVGRVEDATRWTNFLGNLQGQGAVMRPGIGLFVKSQHAFEPFPIHHTALWVAPRDQKWIEQWYQQNTHLTPLRDAYKNLFLTIGAGLPNGEDTTVNCAVPGVEPLIKGINRAGDVTKIIRAKEQLPVADWLEAAVIRDLLDAHHRYSDTARYACFPDSFTGFYNSNSYVHSLLVYAQVPHFAGPPKSPTPGWNVLIPTTYFAPK